MTATATFGAQLQIGDGGGTEVFTAVARLTNITPMQLAQEQEDATDHQSTGGYEEAIPTGVLRTGEVNAEGHWFLSNATQSWAAGLLKDWRNKTLRNFKIVFNADMGAVVWPFPAFVRNFNPGALPVSGKATFAVVLKPSGSLTLA